MEYQHFDHHHLLISLQLDEGEEINCKACERLIFEPFHGCLSCNYYLHDQCLNTPRWLEHPSHPSHSLTLLPSPTYLSASYTCNACGSTGNSFSLSCSECEFDLHLHCANMPNKLLLHEHPHELKLTFDFSSDENNKVMCDICGGDADNGYWLYYCEDCNIGTHFDCAISRVQPEFNQVATNGVPEPDRPDSGQPSTAADDMLNSHKQMMNDMLYTQVEMMKLNNKLHTSRMIADIYRSFRY